jgi:hypothetical protein
MSRMALRFIAFPILIAAFTVPALAYNLVNTSWTVNCVFSPSCTAYVTDHGSPLLGSGTFQSRIHQGQPGSAAAGKWVYRYRVNLTQVAGITYLPYVDQVAIPNFGPLKQYDYNADAVATDEVFVVTSGGIGSVGLSSAFGFFGWSYFYFSSPVYAGSYPGGGQSSYFFGLVSDYPPVLRNISVRTDSGWVTVTGYAPQLP